MAKANEEGISLTALNKEIDSYSTDATVVQQIEKDFQDVIRDFSGDPDLELFKIKYETLYNSLKEGYENEVRWTKKCKDHNSEIAMYTSKVLMTLKLINEDNAQAEVYQKELEDKWHKIEDLKQKEKELREKIFQARQDVVHLNKQCDRVIDEVEEYNIAQLNEKKRMIEELQKNQHAAYAKLNFLRTQNQNVQHDLRQEELLNMKQIDEISSLQMKIALIDQDSKKEERRKREMDEKMATTKQKIDEAKLEQTEKQAQILQIKRTTEQINQTILLRIKEKEIFHTRAKESESVTKTAANNVKNQAQQLKTINEQLAEQRNLLTAKQEELKEVRKDVKEANKERDKTSKMKLEAKKEREDLTIEKDKRAAVIEREKQLLEVQKKERDQLKEDIEKKLKERTIQQKSLKKQEDVEHNTDDEIINLINRLKKTENQALGYETSNHRIRQQIDQLQREQEKYGIEASQAHAKFYQTVEEVKIKNNQIAELQKKNAEVEAKLKHQQNLYETVRSDRNVYSKNLLESQEEISELTKKYTRMTHQVDQLKEEIKAKDQALVREDLEYHKVEDENNKIEQESAKVEKNIKATEEVIKNQENHISRLKYIIAEAQTEKQRQQKDYEMVVNERDILGTQLIKRNQESQVLYEKIKLNHSTLAKGEINFREREVELKSLKDELTTLRNELKCTQDQIACIGELKSEINNLEKDLLNEKNKVKALQDELENPMNVHRWRKLEATDQENFERILKIQTLQRRLIAKTEEVNEKENLIREKEKLFMELKNILSRQPGVEIHQQLASYKESLKEKTGQMKKMLGELKQSQDQVDVQKYQIDRLKDNLMDMKNQYFAMRKEQDRENEQKQEKANRVQDMLTEQKNQIMAQAGINLSVGQAGLKIG